MENLKFKDLNISEELQKAIEEIGFEEATPIQSQAIPYMLEGRDVIGLAQTGTGKTGAFGIPMLEMIDESSDKIQFLVLSPTRELAIQTADEIKKFSKYKPNVKILSIYGGQDMDRQITALKKKPQIIVGTPGRIMDHMRRKTIKLDSIRTIVLDEADEMLDMGFRDDLDIILKDVKGDRQTVLFSATMSKEILKLTEKYQHDVIKIEVKHKELTAPKIKQYYIECREGQKIDVLARILDSSDTKQSLVFCNTKRKVDEVKAYLQTIGYTVEAIHGDMKQSQRSIVMKNYKNGIIDILVATDVAARGLDVENIDIVFNYDVPNDEEYYVHRIGRTGRAGREGASYTFVSSRELYKLRDIQKYTKAVMEPYKMPSVNDVLDRKISKQFDTVKSILEKSDLKKYVEYVQKFIEDTEGDSVSSIDVAAALLRSLIGTTEVKKIELPVEDKEFDDGRERRRDRRTASPRSNNSNSKRMFINLGKLDGINGARQLVTFISEKTGIDENNINDTCVLEKFSFFNVDKEFADNAIKAAGKFEYNDRQVSIEETTSDRGENKGERFNSNRSKFSGSNSSYNRDRRPAREGNRENGFNRDRKPYNDRKSTDGNFKKGGYSKSSKPRSFNKEKED